MRRRRDQPGFRRRRAARLEVTAGRPLLTAAIIVKDEAEHLRRCLASIRGLCDGIVVVDTGSTDDTIDVARLHDAIRASPSMGR